ncbi:phage tail tape measure protein [Micromonospora humidisoli]|uniref:Phage tail tape measure protein n=1 Tax=Micromonospora humidisoli TaxID=2807622 RepID=A0ABS2JAM0_9ACTN|nr:phage tail tape measure protein [Micromonospora humidisoli]MBM7083600.1 phage tail tape measure protein [Micromonospora humidisoli]
MSDTSLVFNILAKDKASGTFNKLKGVAATAGLAIGAALAAGVASTLAQSKTDALLAAQLGAGTPAAASAGRAAGDVYARGVVETMEEATAAVRAAMQNALVPSGASTAQIDAVASKVANLSKVMEEDAGRVSTAVSQMIRTGMVKSASEGFDLLQRGVEMGVNKSQDLIDTFNEYGTQFRKLGVDGPAALGLLSQAVKAGARDSDTAADALKEFAIRAVDGSATTAAGFAALGLSGKQMAADIAAGGPKATAALDQTLDRLRGIKDPVKQGQVAVQLFGTKAEDLGAALLAMDPSKATTGLGQLGGAADRAGRQLEQSAGAKLEAFKRTAQQALVENLAKAIPYIEKTFGFLARNSSWVTPLTAGLVAFAGVIYTVSTAMKVWAVVQAVLNLELWSSPITWVVLAIVALVAIIVIIAVKTDWFQRLWAWAWGGIKAGAAAVWSWLQQHWPLLLAIITGPIGLAVLYVVRNWDKIKAGATSAKDWVVSKFTALAQFVFGMGARIGRAARGMFDGVKSAFRNAINWIIGKWNGLSFTIGGGSFMGVSVPSASFGTPNIPYLAKGGTIDRSGLAVVGERGPELLSLNRGAQVTPLTGRGGGVTVIELRSGGTALDDLLVEILRGAIKRRGGNVQVALGRS